MSEPTIKKEFKAHEKLNNTQGSYEYLKCDEYSKFVPFSM